MARKTKKIILLLLIPVLALYDCGGGGSAPATVTLERVFQNLAFNFPIAMVQPPGDDSTWFLIERKGRVLKFDNNPAAASTTLALDISAEVDQTGEGGLLGIAFHPSFSGSGEVYLSYTVTGPEPSIPLVSKVSRFTMDRDGIISQDSESPILTVNQPATNHNGGDIHFGPEGYLYIALGDGGGGGDPYGNGQDTTTLLGSMLRIDVDKGTPYSIPADNIFASSSTSMPEIYAWGLRNPWRFTFDPPTGDLWAGDVGQGAWEEIDLVISGGNYGWNIEEGDHCYSPPVGCDDTGLIDPVYEYGRTEGRSVTGGFVYRGSRMPALYGHYLFADWVSGNLWGFRVNSAPVHPALLANTSLKIVSFAQGQDLELYAIDLVGGGIYRLSQAQ